MRKKKSSNKMIKNVARITAGVKKAASKAKKKLKITYNRSTHQWERPKYMRKAEFERQLAEKEAIYTKRRARDVKHLFERANERIRQLMASGLDSEALRKLDDSGRESYYFSTEGKNKEELIAEIQTVRDFMQNPTSTLTGAEQYTREMLGSEWKELHGGSYEELFEEQAKKAKELGSFDSFNDRIIKLNEKFYSVNNDQARLAFAAYREAMTGGLAAEGMYDSETLITYAFSVVEERGYKERTEDTMTDVIQSMRDFVDMRRLLKSKEFEKGFAKVNAISEVVADEGEEILESLGIR